MTENQDMGASADAEQALVNGAASVSALTGFDPSRKDDLYSIQLDAAGRGKALRAAENAARALQWLHQYGRGVLAGGTYGLDFHDADKAEDYLSGAREAFANVMAEYAIGSAQEGLETAYAIAMEAAKPLRRETGSTEGNSAGRRHRP